MTKSKWRACKEFALSAELRGLVKERYGDDVVPANAEELLGRGGTLDCVRLGGYLHCMLVGGFLRPVPNADFHAVYLSAGVGVVDGVCVGGPLRRKWAAVARGVGWACRRIGGSGFF